MIDKNKEVPLFDSRLNSMGSRRDLWTGDNSVLDWIARQGAIEGLDLVDFNCPQHLNRIYNRKSEKGQVSMGMEGWLTLESYRNRQALSNTHRENGSTT